MTSYEPWFSSRTWAEPLWSAAELVAAKAGRTVSVVLPALDEQETVAGVVGAVIPLVGTLVDEVVVVDSGSTDDTVARARAAGARVVSREEALPGVAVRPGKGEVLWRALAATTGDVIVYLDSDLVEVDERFVISLLGPVLTVPAVELVKGFYLRPLRLPGSPSPRSTVPGSPSLRSPLPEQDMIATGGGRVTELVARPALAALRPELAGIVQPLGGEYAATRELLESLPFAGGYGVELGLLLDTHRTRGLDAIAQVDLGVRKHRHRSLRALGVTAAEVLDVALRRCAGLGGGPRPLTQFVPVGGQWLPEVHDVATGDRPPMRELVGPAGEWRPPLTR